jgi:hypothetical protein
VARWVGMVDVRMCGCVDVWMCGHEDVGMWDVQDVYCVWICFVLSVVYYFERCCGLMQYDAV